MWNTEKTGILKISFNELAINDVGCSGWKRCVYELIKPDLLKRSRWCSGGTEEKWFAFVPLCIWPYLILLLCRGQSKSLKSWLLWSTLWFKFLAVFVNVLSVQQNLYSFIWGCILYKNRSNHCCWKVTSLLQESPIITWTNNNSED